MNPIKTLLYSILFMIIVHSFTFCMEYLYQRYCYNISLFGYLTSFVTTNSNTCIAVKNIIHNLNGFISNNVLQNSGLIIIIFKKLLNV